MDDFEEKIVNQLPNIETKPPENGGKNFKNIIHDYVDQFSDDWIQKQKTKLKLEQQLDEQQHKQQTSCIFYNEGTGDNNNNYSYKFQMNKDISGAIKTRVSDLIYWKDIKATIFLFLSLLLLLLSLSLFSLLSVISYILLIILTITLTYRLYKNIISAIKKTGEGNPFKKYLDMDIGLSHENSQKLVNIINNYGNIIINEFRRLLLIEDIIDSIKFGLLLWILTYIGSWFNGMTIIIIILVGIFTLPKFYDVYQVEINKYWLMIKEKINETIKIFYDKVKQIKIPGCKKKTQ